MSAQNDLSANGDGLSADADEDRTLQTEDSYDLEVGGTVPRRSSSPGIDALQRTNGAGHFPPDDDLRDHHPLENPNFQISRRPRATRPGAVAVVRRGLESSELQAEDEWDPTTPQDESRDNREVAPSPNEGLNALTAYISPAALKRNLDEISTRRMLLYASIAIVVLGGAAAGIVVAVSFGNRSDDSPSEPEVPKYTEPPVSRCDFDGIEQPDPILQCQCDGNITVLTDETVAAYNELKETFVPTLFPNGTFDEYAVDSCEPQNTALLWLAKDAADQDVESWTNRYLLSLLYAYWIGLEWTNDGGWLTSATECSWFGVTCTDRPALVTGIDLNENNLQGSLVSELGLFPDIQAFVLGTNALGGSIPTEIADASTLKVVNLEFNRLEGPIPSSIGQLVNLREFYAEGNNLSKNIPNEIVNLENLEELNLNTNQLTGTIPVNLGLLRSLTMLGLARNQLMGPIPQNIGLLTNLNALVLQENRHTGTLPPGLFSLSSLHTLIIGYQDLTGGPIPTEIGQLTNLTTCMLPSLQLNGTIPNEMGALTKLTSLHMPSNFLSGTIPASLGNLVNANIITLHLNELEGTVPDEICALTGENGVLEELVVSCGVSRGPDCACCTECTEL